MDIFSWLQSKLNETAVLLGFVAVVQVSFLSPTITEQGQYYVVDLALEDLSSAGIMDLLDNSVHLGIEYSVGIYRTDNRRQRFTLLKEARYNSLNRQFEMKRSGHQRYGILPYEGTTNSEDEVLEFLSKIRFKVRKEYAYSTVVKAALRVFNVDDPELEGNLWGNRKPAITFYFKEKQRN